MTRTKNAKSPGAQASAPPPPGATAELPVARIRPWPGNPRRSFDADRLGELAASVRAQGVLQPILVRPWPEDDLSWRDGGEGPRPLYQIAAGERRWRAACQAGLTALPAVVRELTDRDLLEIAVVENEQREDVPPLEKADGYARLVEAHGVPVEELAARVGQSVSTIRSLLKLRQLPELARAALARGLLPAATAELIARVPGAEARERLTRAVLVGDEFSDPTEEEARAALAGGVPEPLSYRQTRDLVRRHYVVELGKAPFRRASADLVPAAGSCDACPKRVGNLAAADLFAAEDYAGVRADVCTDPACYREKVEAHGKRLLEEAGRQGRTVLPEAEAARLFESWDPTRLKGSAGYVDLADHADHASTPGGKAKTYKQLVGKQLAGQVVVAVDGKGHVHELVPAAAAAKVLRAEHGASAPAAPQGGGRPSAEDRQAAERRQKAAAGKAAALKANAAVAEAVRLEMAGVVGWRPEALAVLRRLVEAQVEICWSDACRRVSARRALAVEGQEHRGAIRALARSLTGGPELLGLLAELLAAKRSLDWSSEWYGGPAKDETAWWKQWGIDRAQLVKEALAEKKAAKQGGKPAANGKRVATGVAKPKGGGTCPPILDAAKAPPDGTNPVTRDTPLRTLRPPAVPMTAFDALTAAGLATVGQLLERAAARTHGSDLLQKTYGLLREITAEHGNALGDQLVDTGLIGAPVDVRVGSRVRDRAHPERPAGRVIAARVEDGRVVGDVTVEWDAGPGGRPKKPLRTQSTPDALIIVGAAAEVKLPVPPLRVPANEVDGPTQARPSLAKAICGRCGGLGVPCAPALVEEALADLDGTDCATLLPLDACPGPLAAAFRQEAAAAAEPVPEEALLCVDCLIAIEEAQRRKRKAKKGKSHESDNVGR